MEKLKVLDLFSGIGGFSLGLERTGGFETVAFCEIDPFCQKVLKKHWPDVPIYNDVRKVKNDYASPPPDVISGGYPCQPFSTAGKRRGQADDRHLWPAMFGLIEDLRPTWVIGENVSGHVSMGLDQVLSDLEGASYSVRTFIIPACSLGAHHRRDRTWIVAHAASTDDCRRPSELRKAHGGSEFNMLPEFGGSGSTREILADPLFQRLQIRNEAGDSSEASEASEASEGKQSRGQFERAYTAFWEQWEVEPSVGRVADGVSGRVDRLKSLGNAVVPQIPEILGHAILAAEGRHG